MSKVTGAGTLAQYRTSIDEIHDANSVDAPTDLGAGTALAIGTSYFVALSAIRTLTFTGTPAENNFVSLKLAVTGGPHVLTIPTSSRTGTSGTTTSISLTTGTHVLVWRYINAAWVLGDTGTVSVPVDTATYAASQTLTATECYGYVVYVTGAATITLPVVADGMSVTVITIGAVAVSIDPNIADKIWLDGTALDDGDKITNASTAGDIAVLTYYSALGWYASTNSWTDGGV
jgi:hypothetical protein